MQSSFLPLFLLIQPFVAPGPAQAHAIPEYARAFNGGDYGRAKALAGERLKVRPADVQARIVLARSDAVMGRLDTAYAGFRQALRLDPRNPDALYYLGIAAGALAEAEYGRLMEMAPRSARAHQLRGRSYQAQGKAAEAEAEYEAALAAGPPSAEVLVALGDLRRAKLRFPEARAAYSQAVALAPGEYDALYGLGVCDSYAGEHARAAGLFRRALRVAPDSAPARLALGISLLQTGETTAAVTELEEAARLEPRMRQAYYQLGRAYQTLGRSRESEAAFARSRELLEQEHEADAVQPAVSPEPPR
jgi:Tfp pilus assembly protein PilF